MNYLLAHIPDRHIMQRWCKGVKDGQSNDYASKISKKDPMLCSSVWRLQMRRKMNSLIAASQLNKQSRAHCDDYFDKLKQLVKMQVGSIYYEDDGQGKGLDSSKNVLNPLRSRKKGVCHAVQQGVLSQHEDAAAMLQQEQEAVFQSNQPFVAANYTHLFGQCARSIRLSLKVNNCKRFNEQRNARRRADQMVKYPNAKVINLGIDDPTEPIPKVITSAMAESSNL
ncbi:hypothetical protein Cgig2_015289 [Carnegiea gigantea]|uniref:Uncharacterized protein n=1 Tax=Carnegiea gigantea TaxID=171969 RepID=A0A9Q1K8N2_9CARY|nr:hypothetical protein Cgig2_015289 [Carnegiea gigantea]